MRIGILPIIFIIFLLMIPSVNSVYVKETCLNSTHIQYYADFTLSIEAGTPLDYVYNQVHQCTYGCEANKCVEKGSPEMQTFMLLINIFAFIPFILMFFVNEQKIVLAIVASILFFIAAFASFNLNFSTWNAIGLPYINFGLGLLSIIYMLVFVFIQSQQAAEEKRNAPIG